MNIANIGFLSSDCIVIPEVPVVKKTSPVAHLPLWNLDVLCRLDIYSSVRSTFQATYRVLDLPTISVYVQWLNVAICCFHIIQTSCAAQRVQHRCWNPLTTIWFDLYIIALSSLYYWRSSFYCKRAARTVLTGMCYSVGSATRQGSSSPTRFIGQSAMTSRT